jgi:cytochrome b561
MVEPLRHRQTKGAETDMLGLTPPRHTPTLPFSFVTTVLGWAGTNAYGDPVSLFGLFDFPTILGKDQPLSDRIIFWHLICGILIGLIVALHIGGALYHRLVKGDRVLQRMT